MKTYRSKGPTCLAAAVMLLGVWPQTPAPTHAQQKPGKFIEVEAGKPHNGLLFNVEVNTNNKDNAATPSQWLFVKFTTASAAAHKYRNAGRLVELRINGQTQFQWQLERLADSKKQVDVVGKAFGHLVLHGVKPGKAYPYEVIVWIDGGIKVTRRGQLKVIPPSDYNVRSAQKREKDYAAAEAKLKAARRGSWAWVQAADKWHKEARKIVEARLWLGRSVDEVWPLIQEMESYASVAADWTKPGDFPPPRGPFAVKWEVHQKSIASSMRGNLMGVCEKLGDPRAIDLLKELGPPKEGNDSYHYRLANRLLAVGGRIDEASDELVRQYELQKRARADARPLARDRLPRDLRGKETVDYAALREQACKLRGAVLLATDDAERKKIEAQIAELDRQIAKEDRLDAFGENNENFAAYGRLRKHIASRVTDAEKQTEALALFDDYLYFDPDGRLHGSLDIAVNTALPDNPINTEPIGITPRELLVAHIDAAKAIKKFTKAKQWYDQIKDMSAFRDLVKANETAAQMIEAIDDFSAPTSGVPRVTLAQRLVKLAAEMEKLYDSGALSLTNMQKFQRALDAMDPRAQEQLADLSGVLRRLQRAHRNADIADGLRLATSVTMEVPATARTAELGLRVPRTQVTKGARQVGRGLANTWARFKEGARYATTITQDQLNGIVAQVGETMKGGLFQTKEFSGVDKVFFALNAARAFALFQSDVDKGVPWPEASYRRGAELAVDFAFTRFPVVGAIDLVSWITVHAVQATLGKRPPTLSEVVKGTINISLDMIAEMSSVLGDHYAIAYDGGDPNIVLTIDALQLQARLARTECQLSGLVPGANPVLEDQLLRRRRVFRQLLRAQEDLGGGWKEVRNDKLGYWWSMPSHWNISKDVPRKDNTVLVRAWGDPGRDSRDTLAVWIKITHLIERIDPLDVAKQTLQKAVDKDELNISLVNPHRFELRRFREADSMLRGAEFVYRQTSNGKTYWVRSVWFYKHDKLIWLSAWVPTHQEAQDVPIVNRIIDSFYWPTLKDGAPAPINRKGWFKARGVPVSFPAMKGWTRTAGDNEALLAAERVDDDGIRIGVRVVALDARPGETLEQAYERYRKQANAQKGTEVGAGTPQTHDGHRIVRGSGKSIEKGQPVNLRVYVTELDGKPVVITGYIPAGIEDLQKALSSSRALTDMFRYMKLK